MDDHDWLSDRFQDHRSRLRGVAYQMLGSMSEADDALQDAWLRVSRANAAEVENVGAWLTTVVARVCLNALRARTQRREQPLDPRMPDPIITPETGVYPEHEAVLADSVGIAMLVVLESLSPAERLAFVLHDMFAVPFDEIAPMIDRSPAAARQLASRARRRVRGEAPTPDPDPGRQRAVVEAFLAAAREGDLDRLISVLHPEVVLRADGGTTTPGQARELRGARNVAEQAAMFHRGRRRIHPVLVNGAAGIVTMERGRVFSVLGFTVVDGLIVAIDVLYDPDRLQRLDLAFLEP